MLATAERPVEIAAVGGLSCLYRTDTGAISLINAAGRDLWQRLHDNAVRLDLSDRAEARALAGAWRSQGFLDPADKHVEAEMRVALFGIGVDHGYMLDRCYALGSSRACRLTVSEPVLADLLAAVLKPLASDAIDPVAWIDVFHGDDGAYHVVVDGTERFQGEVALARSEALRHVLLALIGWDQVGALLHATTVAHDAGGITLIGASGSGKSTLAAELVAAGCRHVADDLSALDRERNAVHPFPLGLSVKSGSWETVGRQFPALHDIAPLVTRSLSVRYLDLSAHAVQPDRPVMLSALVFPVYAPGTVMECERLSPEAALNLAVATGSEPDGTPRSIHPLARLCNEVPAWHLAYGDGNEAARFVLETVSQSA